MSNSSDENLPTMQSNHRWLEDAFRQIKTSYDVGHLPHGLLVIAPERSGKGLLANTVAQSILCEKSRQQLNMPCGSCKACYLVKANTHPDLSEIDRLVDNKGKQKQSIGIDQIRHLTNKLAETSQLGGWRVAIITSVEKMTRGAFNAILKTLEEPGEQTLLLMLASSSHQVPATIRSRCQLLPIKFDQKQLVSWLISETGCDDVEANEALNNTFMAPFAARDFINNQSNKQLESLFTDLDLVFKTQLTPLELFDRYASLDNQLWVQLASYFRMVQLEKLKSQQNVYEKVPNELPSKLYSQLLDYNRGQCAGSNLQTKLQLEAILIQWFEIGRKIVHYSNR